MTESTNKEDSILKVLLEEYDQRRNEIIAQKQRYDKQEQILNAYVSLAATLVLGIISGSVSAGTFSAKISNIPSGICAIVLTIVVLVAFYQISNLMESLYLIHAHSARSAAVENKINQHVNSECLLLWDSQIAPRIFSPKFQFALPFIGPNILVGVWSLSVFLGLIGLLSYVCWNFAPGYFWLWFSGVLFFSIYHVYDWFLLAIRERPRLDSIVTDGPKSYEDPSWVPGQGLLVFLGTFCFGFLPLLVLSIQTKSFRLSSAVSVPLMLIPSVFLGDSILLPIFNGRAWMLVAPNLHNLSNDLKKLLIVAGVASVVFSTGVMLFEHMLWLKDPYTGFIKLSVGHLSMAGVWHLLFSSMEMAAIAWFLFFALLFMREPQRIPRRALLQTWGVVWLYSMLCIPDYLFRRTRLSLTGVRLSDAIALTPFFLVSAAYLLLWYLTSQKSMPQVQKATADIVPD